MHKNQIFLLCCILFASFGLYAKESPSIAVSDLLDAQGRIVNRDHLSGNVDFSGYQPVIDDCGGLAFLPMPLTSGWNAFGSGLNNTVWVIAISGSDVYVGGEFTNAGGNPNADNIARWDGSTWNALGSGVFPNSFGPTVVTSIAISGSEVYIGGNFSNVSSVPGTSRIARWDGSTWRTLGSGLGNTVLAMVLSGSDLYVGGSFLDAGGNSNADYIARWDGSTWNALGSGLSNFAYALAISGSDVYVGGTFLDAGGNANADRIARCDGSTWHALGSGLNTYPNALAISGSDVYAVGYFTDAGGNANADYIARWDGSTWNALGSGLNNSALAIMVSGSDVYVGGNFTDAGGNADADRIARWDGNAWNALGSGAGIANGAINAIAISGSDVYVGGNFTDAGGNTSADRIARWEAAPLPVELVSLEARQQAQAVQLDWLVAAQNNNAGWHVEHSTDGTSWARIGWVPGDGDVRELKKYSFLHPDPARGQNYYRLLQKDIDGQSEYSPIRTLHFSGGPSKAQVYPNPVKDLLHIVLDDELEAATADIIHMSGQHVRTVALEKGQPTLSVGDLIPGDYLLSITSDARVTTLRFTVLE